MILLTGATGLIGGELLSMLIDRGEQVRALARDPRKLGSQRVNVQIALGDLADPFSLRNAMRGVSTVIHLAATIRDQPRGTIEELNGLATLRLVRAAERAGVERFIFFSALNATGFQRTRFFRAKALAEHAVESADLETTVFASSIVYAPGDPWVRLMERFSLLPVLPIAGSGQAKYQPIGARDVARCAVASLERDPQPRYELAGPDTLTYEEIARIIASGNGHRRPLLHVPLPVVRQGLRALELVTGTTGAFATWDEAELMEVAMTTPRGTSDAERLGVKPAPMTQILGVESASA